MSGIVIWGALRLLTTLFNSPRRLKEWSSAHGASGDSSLGIGVCSLGVCCTLTGVAVLASSVGGGGGGSLWHCYCLVV